MTALTANCPCAQKQRLVFPPDTAEPMPANGNALCFWCGRGLRTNASAVARRATFDDELAPGEQGRWVASRARGVGIRGRPFDRSPPINPKARQSWDDPGEPS